MGKCTITENNGEGLYKISADTASDKVTSQKNTLLSQIAALADAILDLETEYNDLEAAGPATPSQADYNAWKKALAVLQTRINTKKLEKAAFQKQYDYLNYNIDLTELADRQVWCADYTTDLTGEHATIEVIREWDKGLNIRPAWEGDSVYSAARDGQLEYPIVNSAPAAYYNWAIHPGAQRWRPIYRYAILTAINKSDDTCTLIFEPMDSRAGSGFIVNHFNALPIATEDNPDPVWISIDYMDCNSQPFEIGDEVIVEFPTKWWTDAKVIGYKHHPQPCVTGVWWIRASDPVDTDLLNDYMHICFEGSVDLAPPPPGGTPGGQLILSGAPIYSSTPWYGIEETEYCITPTALIKLNTLPAIVQLGLESLLNIKYATAALFETALIAAIGDDNTDQYKNTIKRQALSPFANSPLQNRGDCRRLLDNAIVPGTKIDYVRGGVVKAYTYYHTSCITGGTVKALNYRTYENSALRYIVEIHGRNYLCTPSDNIRYKIGDYVFVAHSRNQNQAGANPAREKATRYGIATKIIEQINALRKAAGVQPLIANYQLAEAAFRHAEDMKNNCFIGHTGSDSTDAEDRITDTGFLNQTLVENAGIPTLDPTGLEIVESFESEIFVGATGENVTWAGEIDDAVDNWQLSPLHLKLMLAPRLTSVGIGVARLDKNGACTVMVGDELKIQITAQAGTYLPDVGYISSDQVITLPYQNWYPVCACFGDNIIYSTEKQLPEYWLTGAHDSDPSFKPTEYFPSEWLSDANVAAYPELANYGYLSPNTFQAQFPVILPLQVGSVKAETLTTYIPVAYTNDAAGLLDLRDTIIVNAKIMRIHRETMVDYPDNPVLADVKTVVYGVDTWLANVPFRYHIEDESYPDNEKYGHRAFKIYDEVLLLIKGARGTGNPVSLEKYIIGFADGIPRRAKQNYLVIRTRQAALKAGDFPEPFGTWGYYYYGGFAPDSAYTADDAVFVWDIENNELYQDCYKWNASSKKWDIKLNFPCKYSDFYASDFRKRHALVSDCPGLGRFGIHGHGNPSTYIGGPGGSGIDNIERRIVTYEDYITKVAGWYTRQNDQRKYYYRPIVRAFEFVANAVNGSYGVSTPNLPGPIEGSSWSGYSGTAYIGVPGGNCKLMNATPAGYVASPGYNSSLYLNAENTSPLIAPFGFDSILANDYLGLRVGATDVPVDDYYNVFLSGAFAAEPYLAGTFYGEHVFQDNTKQAASSVIIAPTSVIAVNMVSSGLINTHKTQYAERKTYEWNGSIYVLISDIISPEHDHSAQCNFAKIFRNHYPEILPEDRADFVVSEDLSAEFVTAYQNLFTYYWSYGSAKISVDTPCYVYD